MANNSTPNSAAEQNDIIRKTSQSYIEMAVRDADVLWKKVVKTVKEHPDMKNWDDDKKIEYFYKDHKDFYNEFPIVCRYMITMGQYSSKAFAKYLTLKALDAKNLPPPELREKNYVEEKWIRRESDYVALLWKSYRKGKCTELQVREVRQQAYDSLKGEFTQFRDKYKQTEEKLKEDKFKHQNQLAKEALERITHTESTKSQIDNREEKGVILPKPNELADEKKRILRDMIRVKIVEQKKAKVMAQIKASVSVFDP